jgi:hypothetical protein
MEITFEAIGLEIANENAFNSLAEDVGKRGEATQDKVEFYTEDAGNLVKV